MASLATQWVQGQAGLWHFVSKHPQWPNGNTKIMAIILFVTKPHMLIYYLTIKTRHSPTPGRVKSIEKQGRVLEFSCGLTDHQLAQAGQHHLPCTSRRDTWLLPVCEHILPGPDEQVRGSGSSQAHRGSRFIWKVLCLLTTCLSVPFSFTMLARSFIILTRLKELSAW